MTRSLAQENGGLGNAVGFVISQLIMASPVLIGVWFAGLRFLWRSERPLWRALAWSYGLLFVFFAVTAGGKPYYVAAAYFFLIAAGAVALEDQLGRWEWWLALTISMLVTLPIVLPVLPARMVGWTSKINPVQVETIGWPEFVSTVAKVWDGLPPAQRKDAVIFTGNYGEAGALNELGHGLPEAVSGQNTVWWWGPGNPHATTVVAVIQAGYPKAYTMLRNDFASVRAVATISNPEHVNNQEYGAVVYLCTGPVRPWGTIWPSLRHYS
jgi:hypothetical protein